MDMTTDINFLHVCYVEIIPKHVTIMLSLYPL